MYNATGGGDILGRRRKFNEEFNKRWIMK